jgi:hypothetical protein
MARTVIILITALFLRGGAGDVYIRKETGQECCKTKTVGEFSYTLSAEGKVHYCTELHCTAL